MHSELWKDGGGAWPRGAGSRDKMMSVTGPCMGDKHPNCRGVKRIAAEGRGTSPPHMSPCALCPSLPHLPASLVLTGRYRNAQPRSCSPRSVQAGGGRRPGDLAGPSVPTRPHGLLRLLHLATSVFHPRPKRAECSVMTQRALAVCQAAPTPRKRLEIAPHPTPGPWPGCATMSCKAGLPSFPC